MAVYGYVWLCRAVYGYVGLCMTVYGYVELCRAVYGYVGLCRAMYGCVWLCMAMYGYVWLCMLCMAMYGYVRLCMAVYGCVWLWMSVYSYVCPYRPVRINYSGRFMGHTWTTNQSPSQELLGPRVLSFLCDQPLTQGAQTICVWVLRFIFKSKYWIE